MEYSTMGDELSVETSLIQASAALDAAGILALESRETENMLKVAETWVRLADFMAALEASRDKPEKPEPKEDVPFGFTTKAGGHVISLGGDFEFAEQLEIDYDEEDDDVRDDDD